MPEEACLPPLGSEQDVCEVRTAREALHLMLLMCEDATAVAHMHQNNAIKHVMVFLRDRDAELRALACDVLRQIASKIGGNSLLFQGSRQGDEPAIGDRYDSKSVLGLPGAAMALAGVNEFPRIHTYIHTSCRQTSLLRTVYEYT